MKPLEVDVIVGALWGDEGKGKYVAKVCEEYDAVLRVTVTVSLSKIFKFNWLKKTFASARPLFQDTDLVPALFD